MSYTVELPAPAAGAQSVTYIIQFTGGPAPTPAGAMGKMALNLSLQLARGEDRMYHLVYNPQGVPVDVSTSTLLFTMKNQSGIVTLTKTTGAGITSQTTQGDLMLTLDSADTELLPPGIYPADIWRTDTGNELDLFVGHVLIEQTPRN